MTTPFTQPDLPIVARLLELGWTNRKLAAESGFNLRTIENWTSRARRPSVAQYDRLARALGCPVADIIDPTPRHTQRPTNPNHRPMGTGGTITAMERAREIWGEAKARSDPSV